MLLFASETKICLQLNESRIPLRCNRIKTYGCVRMVSGIFQVLLLDSDRLVQLRINMHII